MQADFFHKKAFRVLFVFFAILCFCIVGLAYRYYPYQVFLGAEFHFLVSNEARVEVGAEFIKLEGGAGYLLRYEGREYAVLSVYLNEMDGLQVQQTLLEKGKSTQLISVRASALTFRGETERKNAGIYVGALRSLYGCLSVLEESISRLEKGMTQEKTKGVLTELIHQLSFMSEIYADSYPSVAALSLSLCSAMRMENQGILYAKNLRYLLCESGESYVALTKAFT